MKKIKSVASTLQSKEITQDSAFCEEGGHGESRVRQSWVFNFGGGIWQEKQVLPLKTLRGRIALNVSGLSLKRGGSLKKLMANSIFPQMPNAIAPQETLRIRLGRISSLNGLTMADEGLIQRYGVIFQVYRDAICLRVKKIKKEVATADDNHTKRIRND